MSPLDLHIVLPTETHTHTIIFLHGRDSTAQEFAAEIFESQGPDDKTLPESLPTFKWVFPSAGELQASRFNTKISQWFDIWSLEDPEDRYEIQKEGLSRSIARILAVIENEAKIVSYDRIFLAGISQGCATAIHALLQFRQPLAGFIGLSSWLPFEEQVSLICEDLDSSEAEVLQRIRALVVDDMREHDSDSLGGKCLETPVLLLHCEDDEVISVKHGVTLRNLLLKVGFEVEWSAYGYGGHWLNEPEGVNDLVRFIQKH